MKITLTSLGLLLLFIVPMAMGASLDSIFPLPTDKAVQHHNLDQLDEIEFLAHHTGNADFYLGTEMPGDTFCVVFHPTQACSILYANMMFNSENVYQSFIWEYSDAALENSPDGISPNIGMEPELVDYSPLGAVLAGPFDREVSSPLEDDRLITQSSLEGGILIDPPRPFVVGYVIPPDASGAPYLSPIVSNVYPDLRSYTWSSLYFNSDDHLWGGYSNQIPDGTVADLYLTVAVSYMRTDVTEGVTHIPNSAILHPSYPNPFNATTMVRFTVPSRQSVEICLFDLLGKRVALLYDGLASGTTQQVLFSSTNLPSGTYFIQLATSSQTISQKLFLVR